MAMDEKKCFRYLCKRFPECKHAVISCGVGDDWVKPENVIEDGACMEEAGYPEFEPRTRPR